MNNLLSAGIVPKREQPLPYRQANDAEIGLFADFYRIMKSTE
jgi:hypothetical protein